MKDIQKVLSSNLRSQLSRESKVQLLKVFISFSIYFANDFRQILLFIFFVNVLAVDFSFFVLKQHAY